MQEALIRVVGQFGNMRIWKEKRDPGRHKDWMSTSSIQGSPVEMPESNLIEAWQYFVRVAGFTFEFTGLDQLTECLEYVSQKTHPSTREFNDGLEHYWQRWYERLPKGLLRESKRQKIVAALSAALEEFSPSERGN